MSFKRVRFSYHWKTDSIQSKGVSVSPRKPLITCSWSNQIPSSLIALFKCKHHLNRFRAIPVTSSYATDTVFHANIFNTLLSAQSLWWSDAAGGTFYVSQLRTARRESCTYVDWKKEPTKRALQIARNDWVNALVVETVTNNWNISGS